MVSIAESWACSISCALNPFYFLNLIIHQAEPDSFYTLMPALFFLWALAHDDFPAQKNDLLFSSRVFLLSIYNLHYFYLIEIHITLKRCGYSYICCLMNNFYIYYCEETTRCCSFWYMLLYMVYLIFVSVISIIWN